MHYFRPVKGLRRVTLEIWKFLAAQLRLTSYMFGDRHESEEYTPKHLSWTAVFRKAGSEVNATDCIYDGTFRRVPATDNLALPRDMRATAEVTVDGEPIDDAARHLIELQNAEAEKAKHIVKDDYRIVYIPPQFRRRIILFIITLWILGALFFGVAFAMPIQLGRSFFKLFISHDVHDGYSFIVGFYLLWACYIVGKSFDRMDKRRQRRGVEGPRAELHVYAIKHGLLWLSKVSYMIIFLGLLLPILIAIVMELYLILPIKYAINPKLTPRIRVVDMWCLGVLYAKIAIHVTRMQPPTRVILGIRAVSGS
jgi:E3 ubiquitin-protein ligase MARCH6